MTEGRMAWAEFASCLGLSSPAAAERIHPFGGARGDKGVYDSHRPRRSRLWTYHLRCGDLRTSRTFLQKMVTLQDMPEYHHVARGG